MKISQIEKDMMAALQASGPKTTPYDATAEVIRIDGSTAWVHIPGGVDVTPAELTIDAKAGDIVQVRVSGGRAFLVGNGTAPPTDDTKAIEAQESTDELRAYVATHMQETDEGLLVTKDDSQWKLLIKSDGVDVIDPSGNVVANYSGLVRIGKEGAENITIMSGEMQFNAEDGSNAVRTIFVPNEHPLAGTRYGVRITNDKEVSYIDIMPGYTLAGFTDALNMEAELERVKITTTDGHGAVFDINDGFEFSFTNSQTAGKMTISAANGLAIIDPSGTKVAELDWDGYLKLPAASWGTNKVATYTVKAGIATVCSTGTNTDVNIPVNTWTTVATLPVYPRPSQTVYGTALLELDKVGAVRIQTDGTVQVQVSSATGAIASGSSIYFNLSYAL